MTNVSAVARPRGDLDPDDAAELAECMEDWRRAEALQADVRAFCVEAVKRSSFRAVSEATGFSTNTLQRWKREATS